MVPIALTLAEEVREEDHEASVDKSRRTSCRTSIMRVTSRFPSASPVVGDIGRRRVIILTFLAILTKINNNAYATSA